MPSYHWVVDPEHPQGYLVEYSAEEELRLEADRQLWAAQDAIEDAELANALQMQEQIRIRLDALIAAAAAIDAGTATAAEQREALVLCLRTTARLGRLVVRKLDVAV